MKWFDILKDAEDERIIGEQNKRWGRKQRYGYDPYGNFLGALHSLNYLTGSEDYYSKIRSRTPPGTRYEVLEREKDLKIDITLSITFTDTNRFQKNPDKKPGLTFQIGFNWRGARFLAFGIDFQTTPIMKDFIEIYKQPNSTFKNIKAIINKPPKPVLVDFIEKNINKWTLEDVTNGIDTNEFLGKLKIPEKEYKFLKEVFS